MTAPRELKSDLEVIDYAREVVVKYRQDNFIVLNRDDCQEDRNLLQLLLHLSDIKAILVHDGEVILKGEKNV